MHCKAKRSTKGRGYYDDRKQSFYKVLEPTLRALARCHSRSTGRSKPDCWFRDGYPGGALANVKVEARSPALIESVKTAVTDANGEYQIVDLRPGTYSLAFTLNGFQTAKYENIVLTPSFTATINPVLQVGAVEQSVEVTGQAPIVDITSAVSEKALTQQTLEEVPVGRSVYQVTLFMPGATTTSPDVGGSQTAQITNLAMHGTVDNTFAVDGMEINGVESNNVTATYYNEGFNQAMTVQTSALPPKMAAASQ